MKKLFLILMCVGACMTGTCEHARSFMDNGLDNVGVTNVPNPPHIVRTWRWGDYEHVQFVLNAHWYLEVRHTGQHGAVTVIHCANCPCVHGR